jgi:hypothetical protein
MQAPRAERDERGTQLCAMGASRARWSVRPSTDGPEPSEGSANVFGWRTGSSRWIGAGSGERPKGGRRVWRYRARSVVLGALGVLAAVCLVVVSVSRVLAGPPFWRIVPSPNPTLAESSQLDAVAAIAPHDVWAVGFRTVNTMPQTLTEHWNGAIWQIVPSPNVSGVNNLLAGVAATGAQDVWAVGFSNPGHTLTEHWNGTMWSIIPSPNAGAADAFNALSGVAALATNDVWAVGEFIRTAGAPAHTLIEHWNGASWKIVPSPSFSSPNSSNNLLGVAALSANDIWAVGEFQANMSSLSQTLTEHWNGVSWSIVPSPNAQPGVFSNELVSVTTVAPNDVWAVGFYYKPPPMPAPSETLIKHWNGFNWSIVPSVNIKPGVVDNGLLGVSAVAPNDVWAVGSYGDEPAQAPQTLTEHWNGATWDLVPSPNRHGTTASNVLAGVAAISTNDVWAVGNYADVFNNIQHTLTEVYS